MTRMKQWFTTEGYRGHCHCRIEEILVDIGSLGAINSNILYERRIEVRIFTFQYPLEKQPSKYIFN